MSGRCAAHTTQFIKFRLHSCTHFILHICTIRFSEIFEQYEMWNTFTIIIIHIYCASARRRTCKKQLEELRRLDVTQTHTCDKQSTYIDRCHVFSSCTVLRINVHVWNHQVKQIVWILHHKTMTPSCRSTAFYQFSKLCTPGHTLPYMFGVDYWICYTRRQQKRLLPNWTI